MGQIQGDGYDPSGVGVGEGVVDGNGGGAAGGAQIHPANGAEIVPKFIQEIVRQTASQSRKRDFDARFRVRGVGAIEPYESQRTIVPTSL